MSTFKFPVMLYVHDHRDGITLEFHAALTADPSQTFFRSFPGVEWQTAVDHLNQLYSWLSEYGHNPTDVEILVYDKGKLTAILGQQGTIEGFLYENMADLTSFALGTLANGCSPRTVRDRLTTLLYDLEAADRVPALIRYYLSL